MILLVFSSLTKLNLGAARVSVNTIQRRGRSYACFVAAMTIKKKREQRAPERVAKNDGVREDDDGKRMPIMMVKSATEHHAAIS